MDTTGKQEHDCLSTFVILMATCSKSPMLGERKRQEQRHGQWPETLMGLIYFFNRLALIARRVKSSKPR